MVPIGGKPTLAHTVETLGRNGVVELVINPCYLPEVVMGHLGDGSRGAKITDSLEEEPLDTAAGGKKVAHFFDGPFFVWYGDSLNRCDLRRLYALHRTRGALATIALLYREDAASSGIAGLVAAGRSPTFWRSRGLSRPSPIWSTPASMYWSPRCWRRSRLRALPISAGTSFPPC